MRQKMFKIDIDIKTIFILVLGVALVLSFLFRPSKEIDTYEEEIKLLNQQNIMLLQNNDSISLLNKKLTEDVIVLEESVEVVNLKLEDSDKEIRKLKNRKNEIHSNVVFMDANGVTSNMSNYLKRRH
jgi:hypothetical protein